MSLKAYVENLALDDGPIATERELAFETTEAGEATEATSHARLSAAA